MRSSVSRVRWAFVLVLIGLFALDGSPAAGQSTASIVGQVTDQSGAALPGVTVTATSPALQVPQVTDVTNELGEYRLAPLPIGVYDVAFDLTSFRPAQRQNVRLTVGFTAKIDVSLGLATVAETVTVTGAAPVVDVASTSGSTLFTQEMLEAIPTARNGLISLLNLAPGVRSFLDVGGNMIEENPQARAFGQSGQVWFTIDGVSTTHLNAGGGNGSYYDYGTVDEVRVQSLATDAEFQSRGVQMAAIVKSGGNQFHGSGSWAQNNSHFQSDNIDERLAALGFKVGNALKTQYDLSGDLGGRLVRNKLWFYGGLRKRYNEKEVLNAFMPDGSPAYDKTNLRWRTGKLSYQATAGNRFIGFMQWGRKFERSKTSEVRSFESRSDRNVLTRPAKGEWQGVRGNSLIVSAAYNYNLYDSIIGFNTQGVPGRTDLVTQRVTGESGAAGERQLVNMKQTRGAVTWYKPNWLYGNHELKAGLEYSVHGRIETKEEQMVNYHLFVQNGVPYQFLPFNSPTQPSVFANMVASYVRDSWTVGRRLTLNLGLRFDSQDAFVPEQCREAAKPPADVVFPAECYSRVQIKTWRSVAPRLHAAYDLSGDGRTVIKGGWGRYDHMRQLDPDLLRLARNGQALAVYRWHDLNGNLDYDPGEVNLDRNGPDFVETVGKLSQGTALPPPPPINVVNPNEGQPKYDELSVSLERELIANLAVKGTAVYSRTTNVIRTQNNLRPYETYNVPVTRPDPGPDGSVGTADDPGTMFTYFEFSPDLAGRRFEEFMPINDPNANQDYKGMEVALFKRLSNRWQFMGSYSATKKNIPIYGYLATGSFITGSFDSAHNVGGYTPNDEINRADRTWERNGKLMGAYILPAAVQVSANFEHRSGDQYARQVRFTGGRTIPNILLNVEPIGTQSSPDLNLLSFRVEKTFTLFNTQKVAARVNLYNALNANTATVIDPRSGARFLRPVNILPPRIAELSATYSF
jgi:Carboxypeptidase regulatory-like domain